MLRFVLVIMIVASLFSCATPQAVKEEAQPEPIPEPPLVLPDVKIEEKPVPQPKVITKKPSPVVIEQEADNKYVILNFDDADITTVIETMGDLLSINYILAPGISGQVTIQSYKKFPVKNLFSIFQTILEMNGLTAVKNKDFYIIMPVETAKQQPLDVEKGTDVQLTLDSGFITQIIPLEFVKASDAANLLRGLMPRGTDLIVYEPTNLLIITTRPEGLLKFMKVLEAIDIPPTERENIKTFVYYVENGEAKKLADILKDIYVQQKGTKQTTRTQPRTRTTRQQPGTVAPAKPTVIGGTAGEVEGEVTITSYEDINALIIKSSPAAYLAMLETIKKLDIPAKQVLIEVMVAEVTLTDDLSLGIEWLLKTGGEPATLSGYSPTVKSILLRNELDLDLGDSDIDLGTSELKALQESLSANYFGLIIDPSRFMGLIKTFASYGKVNILSSPHVLALDNKEAKIEVGEDLPIATGINTTSSVSEGTSALVSAGQIQYRTAGIILTVTPHINDKDNVTLKVDQEFSGFSGNAIVGGQEFPSFFTRKAQTTGMVMDGHTLVIAGMISEQTDNTRGGLPFLSKIPVLGYLFGTSSDNTKRTELVIMVTPHVIRNAEEADEKTREFQERIVLVNEGIEEVTRKKEEYLQKKEKLTAEEKQERN